jgi:hypothetical protein
VVITIGVAVSFLLTIRALFSDSKQEIFDIMSPTRFETGLLVFQSPKNRCAIFFAFEITSRNFDKPLVQRALTILLKTLPESTVLALEWTSQRERFITFHIKLEKSSFLARGRELLENTRQSLKNTLGTQGVRLLNGDELMTYFSMGIPGRFQKISIKGRYALNIQTDSVNVNKTFAILAQSIFDNFSTILSAIDVSQDMRMILTFKKTENKTHVAKLITLVSSNTVSNNFGQTKQLGAVSIKQIPASKSLHLLGDILSRNQIHEHEKELDFQRTATIIFKLLSTQWPSQTDSEREAHTSDDTSSEITDPLTWREILAERLIDLELPYQRDNVVFFDRLPIRVDAQLGDLMIFILPQASEDQLNWLTQKIITFLKKDDTKSVVLLLTSNQNTVLNQQELSDLVQMRRIHIISTNQELVRLLKKKTRPIEERKDVTQVA